MEELKKSINKKHIPTHKKREKGEGDSKNPRDNCLTRRATKRQQTHQDPSRRSTT
jgi:hypothetical protein